MVRSMDLSASAELAAPTTEEALEEILSRPTPEVVAALAACPGDMLILGAGGKLGFGLCRLAQRGLAAAGSPHRVVAVSRFASGRERFAAAGIETIAADLLDPAALARLPDAPNVIYLVGTKFGSLDAPGQTWALNTLLPGLVAQRFLDSRFVAFSTGNVYPLTEPRAGGSTEDDAPDPVGEYAQSCLGRERILEYFSRQRGLPLAILRLNYANDLRYGVLIDLAQQVRRGEPIDVAMGQVNVIWQGDVNAIALRALAHCASPPLVVNVSGPETASVHWLARELARRLDAPTPTFVGSEAPTALLSNTGRQHGLFGYPTLPLARLLDWTAGWLASGGVTLNKPTHFQERKGQF